MTDARWSFDKQLRDLRTISSHLEETHSRVNQQFNDLDEHERLQQLVVDNFGEEYNSLFGRYSVSQQDYNLLLTHASEEKLDFNALSSRAAVIIEERNRLRNGFSQLSVKIEKKVARFAHLKSNLSQAFVEQQLQETKNQIGPQNLQDAQNNFQSLLNQIPEEAKDQVLEQLSGKKIEFFLKVEEAAQFFSEIENSINQNRLEKALGRLIAEREEHTSGVIIAWRAITESANTIEKEILSQEETKIHNLFAEIMSSLKSEDEEDLDTEEKRNRAIEQFSRTVRTKDALNTWDSSFEGAYTVYKDVQQQLRGVVQEA